MGDMTSRFGSESTHATGCDNLLMTHIGVNACDRGAGTSRRWKSIQGGRQKYGWASLIASSAWGSTTR